MQFEFGLLVVDDDRVVVVVVVVVDNDESDQLSDKLILNTSESTRFNPVHVKAWPSFSMYTPTHEAVTEHLERHVHRNKLALVIAVVSLN